MVRQIQPPYPGECSGGRMKICQISHHQPHFSLPQTLVEISDKLQS
jgi:hypothetical protein